MALLPFGSPLYNQNNDTVHVKKAGDTMTGDLVFPVNGYIMTDSNGIQWRVTIDTTGHIVTTKIVSSGSSPWLSLGFTNFDT